jgi:hypothetical protein
MKIVMVSLMGLAAAGVGVPYLTAGDVVDTPAQEQQADDDLAKLYQLVQQARAELATLRAQAGIRSEGGEGHAEGAEGRESREGGHAEGREGGEREGGHDEGREAPGRDRAGEGGEESGTTWGKFEKSDMVYDNGARLILEYNAATEAFEGSVRNTTNEVLSQVRVEIHLSSGVELGPTQRIDLDPGRTTPVALSAIGYDFTSWVTHPEAGVEEGHGAEGEEGGEGGHGEGEEAGEHGAGGEGAEGGHGEGGEGGGDRPNDGSLRPLYNQLQLLRGEIRALSAALQGSRG